MQRESICHGPRRDRCPHLSGRAKLDWFLQAARNSGISLRGADEGIRPYRVRKALPFAPTLQIIVRCPCARPTQSRLQTGVTRRASPRPGTNPGRLLGRRGFGLSRLGGAPGSRQQYVGRHRRFAQLGPHPTGRCDCLRRRAGNPSGNHRDQRTRPAGIFP